MGRVVDDVAEGCLGVLFEVVLEGMMRGTGYGILKLFGYRRGAGGWIDLLAWVLGALVWVGLGFAAYWLL